MERAQPSRTAMRAAAHRAAHQIIESGRVFEAPLACAILGSSPATVFGGSLNQPATRAMRLFIAARSRFIEERVRDAITRGLRQYVILGAGLDTFAYRNPFQALQVFEVDHPSTQAWKRQRLRDAGLVLPPSLSFAPVDFEHDTLADGLRAAGFDETRPALFSWLGVVVYLTREAIFSALSYVAARGERDRLRLRRADPFLSRRPTGDAARAGCACCGHGRALAHTLRARRSRRRAARAGLRRRRRSRAGRNRAPVFWFARPRRPGRSCHSRPTGAKGGGVKRARQSDGRPERLSRPSRARRRGRRVPLPARQACRYPDRPACFPARRRFPRRR